MDNHIKEYFDNNAIDRESPVPLYFQLKNIIDEGIKKKILKPGECLPTELEFSKYFNLSRTTVRQSLTSLATEKQVYRIKSKGTFIAQPKIDLHYISSAESFNSQIIMSGRVPKTIVLYENIEQCNSEIASALNIKSKDKIIRITRLRFSDDTPIVIARSYHPIDVCEDILKYDLEKESLIEVFSKKSETRVVKVCRTIEAIGASKEDSKLLEINKGFPLQSFKSTSFNKNGRIVEYCESVYRGDKNKFSVEIKTLPNKG